MEFGKPDFIQKYIKMNARHNLLVKMEKLHSKNWTWFIQNSWISIYVNPDHVGTILAQLGSAQFRAASASDFDYCVLCM